MTRRGRAAVLVVLVLVTGGACSRDSAPSPTVAQSPFRIQIDSLRAEARFEAALPLAVAAVAQLQHAGGAEWQLQDAQREVETLRHLCTVPDSARDAWRRCWRDVVHTQAEQDVNPAAAIAALDAWLAVLQGLVGPETVEVAAALSAKAFVYEQESEVARARDLERHVLEMRIRLHGERHPDVAASHERLAYVTKRGDSASKNVLEHNQRALDLRRELLGENSREYAASLLRRGNYRRLHAQYDAAAADFVAAARILALADGESSPSVTEVLTDHGLMLGLQGRWQEAETLLRRAAIISRERPDTPAVVRALALNQLGVALRELGRCDEARGFIEQAAAVQEERRRRANRRLARHGIYQVTAHRDLALVALCQERWSDAWVSFERASVRGSVEAALARGDLADDVDPWEGLLSRVQSALPDSAAVIGWVDHVLGGGTAPDWPFWIYVVRKTGSPQWVRVDAPHDRGARTMIASIIRLRNDFELEANWPLRAERPSTGLDALAREVHALRFAPIEPLLDGVRRLIVTSPDMNHAIPIEGLIDAHGRPVAERFVTSYAQSALLYAVGRERSSARAPHPWTSLLVGNPSATDSQSVWSELRPLHLAGEEIQDLAQRLGSADVFTGSSASEAVLDSLRNTGSLARYDFIHIATHVDLGSRAPMWSALLMAEAKSLPPGTWVSGTPVVDGRVTADEIRTSWRLNAQLVNLAVCRGLQSRNAPVDGLLGVGVALLDAGAHSLLVSTTTVDDEATAMLFRRFASVYFSADARQRDAAAALRGARLWLRDYRDAGGAQPFRSPVFWAGYVLVGSPD